MIWLGVFYLVNNYLNFLNKKVFIQGQKQLNIVKANDYVQKQLLSIFEVLEEGIVTTET